MESSRRWRCCRAWGRWWGRSRSSRSTSSSPPWSALGPGPQGKLRIWDSPKMLKKCDHLSGCCPLEAVCRQPFDNVTTIYNVDDDLQERVNLPCISPGQAVWFWRRVLMNVWLGMMVMKHLSQVSSQDPGWELSSDWTASERAITACSVLILKRARLGLRLPLAGCKPDKIIPQQLQSYRVWCQYSSELCVLFLFWVRCAALGNVFFL